MEYKTDFINFQKEIQQRNIEHLVHFTPTINLLSIFEQGKLISRALLEENNIDDFLLDFIEFTDLDRFDDSNYINLSISSPNYFLLDKFRKRTQDKPYVNWCVLKITPQYIYQKDTLFAVTNAASTIAKKVYKISGDMEKFKKLFENEISLKFGKIERGGLKDKYPTDVQAEVLVKNEIHLSDILQVCFKDETDLARCKAALSDYDTSNFSVDSTMFINVRL